MGAIGALARAQFRRRWPALLALGVLGGVVGGAAMAAVTAARRTSTAYDRLAAETSIDHARVLTIPSELGAKVAVLPSVKRSWPADVAIVELEGASIEYEAIVAGGPRPPDLFQPIVVRGRMFRDDAQDEVVLVEAFAEATERDLGARITAKVITAEEFGRFGVGFGAPDGPNVDLRVVGIIRVPGEYRDVGAVFGSPALERFLTPDITAGTAVFTRLHDGPRGIPALRRELDDLQVRTRTDPSIGDLASFELSPTAEARRDVDNTARVLVAGLVAFLGIALVIGGFILVQAFARHHTAEAEEQSIELQLGIGRPQRVLARSAPACVAAVLAGVIAVVIAVAASPGSPIGNLSQYEPHPGVAINVALLAVGTLVLMALILAIDALTTMRAMVAGRASAERSTSSIASRISKFARNLAITIGARFAFEPSRGRSAVPVRSALLGSVMGIAGLIAVSTIGSSIDRLVTEPERWGWRGDALVADIKPADFERFLADERVAALSVSGTANVRLVDGPPVNAYGFRHIKDSVGWTMLEGRMPANALEVVLGPRLARREGVGVGGTMSFAGAAAGSPRTLTVVGIGLGTLNREFFGDNVALTDDGLALVKQTELFYEGKIKHAAGVESEDFVEPLRSELAIVIPERPQPVENLHQLGRLPLLLELLLLGLAIAATGNVVAVGARRRRRDFAVLRTLGMTGRSLATIVVVTALATFLVGAVFGVPAGVGIATWTWRAIASATLVATDADVPITLLVALVPIGVILALLLALRPARRAARLQPGHALRAE